MPFYRAKNATMVERERVRLERREAVRGNWITFGIGVLIAFLTANSLFSYLGDTPTAAEAPPYFDLSFPGWTAWIFLRIPWFFYLLLPLALGIIIPLPGKPWLKQAGFFVFVRCSLIWAGVSLYWLPLAIYENSAWDKGAFIECQRVNDHGWCGLHLGAAGLIAYLLLAFSLLLLLAFITLGLRKLYRKLFANRI